MALRNAFGSIGAFSSAIVVCAISRGLQNSSWSPTIFTSYAFAILMCSVLFCRSILPLLNASGGTSRHEETRDYIQEQVKSMQKYAWERNLAGTIRSFRALQQGGTPLTSLMYNTVLRAFICCGNIQGAEEWMQEIQNAGMADKLSFELLIKALVSAFALEEAKCALSEMCRTGVGTSVAAANVLLAAFVRTNHFDEAVALLEDLHSQRLEPNSVTLHLVVKMMSSCRDVKLKISSVERIQPLITGANLDRIDSVIPVPVPCLAAAISRSADAKHAPCVHQIRVTGTLPQIKAARRTLKQLGLLDKAEGQTWPLDGHWLTDDGLTVYIEGKFVRWSRKHASRLQFTSTDRCNCRLTLRGRAAHGQLLPTPPFQGKKIGWDNGDVWCQHTGRQVGQHTIFDQTLSKTLRDEAQYKMCRARSTAMLKCVSKQALHMPSVFEDAITRFLGNDLYYVDVHFESSWNPSSMDDSGLLHSNAKVDISDFMSRRHPCAGVRHCWADYGADSCGQRAWVNGEEVSEACFCRHVGLVSFA